MILDILYEVAWYLVHLIVVLKFSMSRWVSGNTPHSLRPPVQQALGNQRNVAKDNARRVRQVRLKTFKMFKTLKKLHKGDKVWYCLKTICLYPGFYHYKTIEPQDLS